MRAPVPGHDPAGRVERPDHLTLRVDPATALTAVGGCCVVLGGLVAAVSGPLDLARGSWLAAYLVLVGGVAQYAMGQARVRYGEGVRQPGRGWIQLGGWNLGGVAVIAGTFTAEPLMVDAGSALMVATLVIALRATRPAARSVGRPSFLWFWGYRTLLLVLAVSIPVGMLLSHLRHS